MTFTHLLLYPSTLWLSVTLVLIPSVEDGRANTQTWLWTCHIMTSGKGDMSIWKGDTAKHYFIIICILAWRSIYTFLTTNICDFCCWRWKLIHCGIVTRATNKTPLTLFNCRLGHKVTPLGDNKNFELDVCFSWVVSLVVVSFMWSTLVLGEALACHFTKRRSLISLLQLDLVVNFLQSGDCGILLMVSIGSSKFSSW